MASGRGSDFSFGSDNLAVIRITASITSPGALGGHVAHPS